jgi:hypothetical protein
MQADLKQDMKNHENPTGAKSAGHLLRHIFFENSHGYSKKNMPYI